jgi:hypothetical protein
MRLSEDFEEVDLPVFAPATHHRPSQKSPANKFMSETISTNNCTLDLERNLSNSVLKFHYSSRPASQFSFTEVADRLSSQKQITANKIKFQQLELEIKEMKECTFRPKINNKGKKPSLSYFSQKQVEYAKSRNTSLLKLKLEQLCKKEVKNPENKKGESGVHFRLYHESKLMKRKGVRRN